MMNYNMGDYVSLRGAYGGILAELGDVYPNIVVIDADLGSSLKTGKFRERFPERYRNVGIAEAHMHGLAAGFASEDMIPVTHTFAMFDVRAAEPILQSIAHDNANVKIVGSHGGIAAGPDGSSHQAITDVATMRAMPNMTVICPSDALETVGAVEAMMEYHGPVYLRLVRDELPIIHGSDYKFKIGEGVEVRPGEDVTIVSNGATLYEAMKACSNLDLDGHGIHPRVISMPTVKPIDREILLPEYGDTRLFLTVEDHSVDGGLGDAVCGALSEVYPAKVKRVGLDTFAESGDPASLYSKYGLDHLSIAETVRRELEAVSGNRFL